MKNYILLAALAIFFASCQLQDPTKQESKLPADVQAGTVKEVLQTNNYTYILVNVDDNELWVAGPKTEVKTGEVYYFKGNITMKDFQSKELNRNFDQVIFANLLSKDLADIEGNAPLNVKHQADIKTNKQDISIQSGEGKISIADLIANKDKYEKKTITVKGVVTKYNAKIMGKNWIHIQDGTEKDGKFDLVVTTAIQCKLGDTLTLEGKLSLNQDFGYGYKYDLLLEDAVRK